MIGGAALRRGLMVFSCLVAAGCAEMATKPTQDAITIVPPAAPVATPAAADDAATLEPAAAAPAAVLADSIEHRIDEPPAATEAEPPPPSVSTGGVAPQAPEAAAVARALRAAEGFEAAPGRVSAAAEPPTYAETLDLPSLVARLRNTKAISLLTKVAVKNESDDLLEQFRAYHTQRGMASLAELRRSYDSLFHKLHSLLLDADPPLARDIDRSRAAIWALLADPRKFNESQLMGGA